ncbi:hypothetical protein V6N12_061666 [Hibiscus sabdariffa]|uniref:Uncharacterized protein n=1 Tax=Hibiscus sabdariffa TaxID=183260 RepID=A0ABR2DXQ8_9ROSI
MKNNELKNRETGNNLNIHVGESSSDSWDTLGKPRLKRVLGHVDEEVLKKLEKCLIGTMAKSKAKMIVDRSLESSSDSSSVPDHYTGATNMSRSNCNGEDEVARAICLEKGPLVDVISSKLNAGRSLGETIFLGNIQSQEMQPPNQMKNSNPFQTSSEAVRSVLSVTSVEAIGPYIQVDHPVVSWVDVVARHTPEQMSQGDRAGEVITRMHNQNRELDPVTGPEGCEAHSHRIPADKAMDREEFSRSQVHFSTPSTILNVLAASIGEPRRCRMITPASQCAWIDKSSTMFHGLPCFHVERAGKMLKEPKT